MQTDDEQAVRSVEGDSRAPMAQCNMFQFAPAAAAAAAKTYGERMDRLDSRPPTSRRPQSRSARLRARLRLCRAGLARPPARLDKSQLSCL